jgi:bacillithiol system protein YtxJ
MDEHPDVPVCLVDVIGQRPLSREIAGRLSIAHESPQAILLRSGTPVWHASHFGVTAEAMARELRQRGE